MSDSLDKNRLLFERLFSSAMSQKMHGDFDEPLVINKSEVEAFVDRVYLSLRTYGTDKQKGLDMKVIRASVLDGTFTFAGKTIKVI